MHDEYRRAAIYVEENFGYIEWKRHDVILVEVLNFKHRDAHSLWWIPKPFDYLKKGDIFKVLKRKDGYETYPDSKNACIWKAISPVRQVEGKKGCVSVVSFPFPCSKKPLISEMHGTSRPLWRQALDFFHKWF